jgi:hypothetical protein
MEQKYALLARGLANMVLANLDAMHRVAGVLVSTWRPKEGPGASVKLADLSLAMVALARYVGTMDLEPENRERAKTLLKQQADFLLKVAAQDGSYSQEYQVPAGAAKGERDMTIQAFAIRGLLVAHEATGDARYLEGARKTSQTWNRDFWDTAAWLYRNQPGVDRVIYTPVDVGAALAALREMILVDKDVQLLDRFKKFFVQAVDASGMMQAEDVYTGENLEQVLAGAADSDGDGIPFMSRGDGRYGIDAVFAGRVEFDLGKAAAPPRRERAGAHFSGHGRPDLRRKLRRLPRRERRRQGRTAAGRQSVRSAHRPRRRYPHRHRRTPERKHARLGRDLDEGRDRAGRGLYSQSLPQRQALATPCSRGVTKGRSPPIASSLFRVGFALSTLAR